MLILTRKPGESLFIGDDIKVVVVEIKGNQIRLGIEAPSNVRILREEIRKQIEDENRSAAAPVPGDSLDGFSTVLGLNVTESTGFSSARGGSAVLKPVRAADRHANERGAREGSNSGTKKK